MPVLWWNVNKSCTFYNKFMSQLKILESVLSFILIYIFIDRGSKAESFPTDQTDNRGAEGWIYAGGLWVRL